MPSRKKKKTTLYFKFTKLLARKNSVVITAITCGRAMKLREKKEILLKNKSGNECNANKMKSNI